MSAYIKTLGGSDTQVGAIMSTSSVVTIATTPAAAVLVDRYGRRPCLITGGVCFVLGSVAFVFVSGISVWYYLGRGLQGVGFAFYQNAALTLLADLLPPERRAKGIGIYGLSSNAVLAVAPPIAEWLVAATGSYRPVFALATASAVASTAMAWQIGEPPRLPATALRSSWRAREAWELRLPALVGVLQGGGFGVMVTFVPAYAQAAGLAFTPFFVVYAVTLVSIRTTSRVLVDRFNHRAILAPSLLVLTAALAALAPGIGTWQLVVSGLLFGLAQAVIYPVLSAIVIDQSRSEHRGRALGLMSVSYAIGSSGFVMIHGVVADLWGYGWMFAAAAAVLGAGAGYIGRAVTAARGTRERPEPSVSKLRTMCW